MLAAPVTVRVKPSWMVRVEPVAGCVTATLLMLVAVATPRTGVISVGVLSTTNLEPVPVCEAIEVALPTEVIGPVKLALVVTVAALPVVEPEVPDTLPVTFPVRGPENPVADSTAVDELNVSPAFVFWSKLPVAAVTNVGKHVVSDASLTTAVVEGTIAALPSKFTPPIALGVVKVAALVAVEAFPVKAPTKVVVAKLLAEASYVRPGSVETTWLAPVTLRDSIGHVVVSAAASATVTESTVNTDPPPETVTSP
jgi:hypothetical protein